MSLSGAPHHKLYIINHKFRGVTEQQQKDIFDTWLASYKALIFKVVRSYAFTAMDRDDLFQEIGIQVWKSIPTFRNACAVTTWLYRISLNTAMRWSSRERKRRDLGESIERHEFVLQESADDSDAKIAWLYSEISRLDEVDRSIALLLLEGFSYKEMATMVGITETNLGVKVNRIKKKLMAKSTNYDLHGI